MKFAVVNEIKYRMHCESGETIVIPFSSDDLRSQHQRRYSDLHETEVWELEICQDLETKFSDGLETKIRRFCFGVENSKSICSVESTSHNSIPHDNGESVRCSFISNMIKTKILSSLVLKNKTYRS
jgi:hypothetical protein